MKIPAVRNRIRQDLIDIDPESQIFEDETLDRAFLSALEDFSRWIPDERFADLTISNTTYSESLSSGTKPTTLTLLYKLLRFNSVTVTNGATTYVRDTDYTIDYINGIITIPIGSGIPNSTTLAISYQTSRHMFDLSTLTDLRSVTGVEIMIGRVPQESSAFKLLGWVLTLSTNGTRSQMELAASQHVAVYYDARHTPPDDDNDGSLQEVFVEIVIKGAVAQVLFAKALALELGQTAPFDVIDFTTYLSDIATFFTNIISDASASRAALVLASAAAASTATQSSSIVIAVAADIAGIASDLTDCVTSLNDASIKAELGEDQIDTEVASDLAQLAGEATNLSTVLGNAASRLTSAASDVALAFNWLTIAETDRESGETLINSVNPGLDPVAHYIQMASMIQGNADRDIAAADSLTKQADSYAAQAQQFIGMANQFGQSALARIESAKIYMAESGQYIAITDEYLKKAATRIQTAQVRLGLLQSLVNVSEQYVHIAGGFHQGYIGLMNEQNASIQNKLAIMQMLIAKAAEVRQQSDSILAAAERLRLEAVRRYQDFQTICQDRNQTRRSGSSVATLQLGTPIFGLDVLT